jgi:alpha-galactosidase
MTFSGVELLVQAIREQGNRCGIWVSRKPNIANISAYEKI